MGLDVTLGVNETPISVDILSDILVSERSPILPYFPALYLYATRNGLKPEILLAFGFHETRLGLSGVGLPPVFNAWGITKHSWLDASRGTNERPGRFTVYYNYYNAGCDFCDLLLGINRAPKIYVPRGRKTIEEIVPIYAPFPENRPGAYINAIYEYLIRRWKLI